MSNQIKKFAEFSAITDAESLASVAASSLRAGRVAYVEAGKALVALDAITQDARKSDKLLSKKGASSYEIRSGRVMANVWRIFVTPGHVGEDEFGELTLSEAREFEAASLKKSPATMKDHGVFNLGVKAMATEMSIIAETGKTRKEREVSAPKASETPAPKTEEKASETPAPKTEEKASETPAPKTAPAKSPLVEFMELLKHAEMIAADIVANASSKDATEVKDRVTAFYRFIEAKHTQRNVADTPQLENRIQIPVAA